ncbi:5-formyltetrahydrofolate cyclo-ligase [bacterium]|nr:5-formyltetrahydrofolate cyclo-ligase [bacterium]
MKQELRKWAKEERKKLDIRNLSLISVEKIIELEEYKQAQNIMLFYPLKYEIDLLTLLKNQEKNFYLPKIEENNLLCCPYKIGESLCKSCFNTFEPFSQPVNKTTLDLVVVPALAVDKSNYRLGYGGGFYDRFLNGLTCTSITCIAKALVLDTVYPEKHDMQIDKLIII